MREVPFLEINTDRNILCIIVCYIQNGIANIIWYLHPNVEKILYTMS